jgi:hypothetical protein
MARHRRPDAHELDRRTGPLGDGNVYPFAGYQRWVDLMEARELPLVQPRLVRPCVLRWRWWVWTR